MPGRIRDDSIAEVRERARIDEIVSSYVTLTKAGGGSLKGLCPFHDEKSPSFHVTPSRGFFHCFGCQEGGDVLTFLMKIDGLSFAESVERLAERYNVQLKREDDGGRGREERPRGPQRRRLVEANAAAQQFYAEHLSTPEAEPGRRYLSERSFDREVAEHYGMGFAPKAGDALFRHLRGRGFTEEETVAAGLVAVGNRSPYDRFRGRLLWPIREAGGETIGFGARRVLDDDRIDAKFLNTPETTLYKKSQVLYGLDLARREIGNLKQAVVVEGYTDVMACHLAGVGTAVATCGTAFGDDHTRVLRRFLMDHEEFRGEVIFTFDGDNAGQKAALRTFKGDSNFVAQTYVAVQAEGLDPCDVRVEQGDAAVRELVASREPLYRFVLRNVVAAHDLDRADGRIGAVREAAALVVSSRDSAVARSSFARDIAALTGVDPVDVQAEVERASRRPASSRPVAPTVGGAEAPASAGGTSGGTAAGGPPMPDPRDPRFAIERETLKLVVQHPMAIGRTTADIGTNDFSHPGYRAVWALVEAAGGTVAGEGDPAWATRLRDAAPDPATSSLVSALAVEPLLTASDPEPGYVAHHVFRLLELTTLRRIAEVKARLQRTNPVQQPGDYNRMFGELAALEQHRRVLRDHVVGAE